MFRSVDARTVKEWLDNGQAVLVDVREPAEHKAEKIKGASLIPLGEVCASALPACSGKKLVVHCRKGARGGAACQKLLLENPGLEIYNLEGGINAWTEAGLPVAASGSYVLPLDRQVQLTLGIALLIASALTHYMHPYFIVLVAFLGTGLTFAGLSGFCGLALLIAKMPWSKA